MTASSAMVVFSGGQDSTTCLVWALERYERVHTIGFAYGQRHSVEMHCRQGVREAIGALRPSWEQRIADDQVINIDLFKELGQSALTHDVAIEMDRNGLPTTFVPGRNLIFLTAAAAAAYRKGIRHLVLGVCETDYSGYPDCRDDAIKAMQAGPELRHGYALCDSYAANVVGQGANLGAGRNTWRRGPCGADPGANAHLLQWRTGYTSRLGLWLRQMSGLRAARQGLCQISGFRCLIRQSQGCRLKGYIKNGSDAVFFRTFKTDFTSESRDDLATDGQPQAVVAL